MFCRVQVISRSWFGNVLNGFAPIKRLSAPWLLLIPEQETNSALKYFFFPATEFCYWIKSTSKRDPLNISQHKLNTWIERGTPFCSKVPLDLGHLCVPLPVLLTCECSSDVYRDCTYEFNQINISLRGDGKHKGRKKFGQCHAVVGVSRLQNATFAICHPISTTALLCS